MSLSCFTAPDCSHVIKMFHYFLSCLRGNDEHMLAFVEQRGRRCENHFCSDRGFCAVGGHPHQITRVNVTDV